MKQAVCARSFQFRGGIVYAGRTLRLTEAELSDPFVAAHVYVPENGEKAVDKTTNYFGNGMERRKPPKPGRDPEADPSEWSLEELMSYLVRMGVGAGPKPTREKLVKLARDAMAASAGSVPEGNGPAELELM